ncbi:MAG: MoaD/ThiS family protein [Anaerolineales bacterium]|uniref:MoaD/ThiS family protein n=1 Tax=Candidatus Desulfolinea nitratireducens TaxID=2841698 RepID=A0A8J6NLG5_9CHLR|nr:MoaD/ThiS family protein [Candidatus Desulfolinea nitratireducens]MBL6961481.1 MoaD/ThiS family protein [Anaerolineales bacterium]
MKINLQLYSILREKLPASAKGRAVMHFDEGAMLADLLGELDIQRKVVISVNGTHETNKAYPLQDGDIVRIFSSISGG